MLIILFDWRIKLDSIRGLKENNSRVGREWSEKDLGNILLSKGHE